MKINGKEIPFYPVVNAHDYLMTHDKMSQEEADAFKDQYDELYEMLNQIIALKHSCYLLRQCTHSCQSMSDDLYKLKKKLVRISRKLLAFAQPVERNSQFGLEMTIKLYR